MAAFEGPGKGEGGLVAKFIENCFVAGYLLQPYICAIPMNIVLALCIVCQGDQFFGNCSIKVGLPIWWLQPILRSAFLSFPNSFPRKLITAKILILAFSLKH